MVVVGVEWGETGRSRLSPGCPAVENSDCTITLPTASIDPRPQPLLDQGNVLYREVRLSDEKLAASLATKIADYRLGEIEPPDGDHVLRWVRQFPEADRSDVLSELDHVLGKTYISKTGATSFLGGLLTLNSLAGDDPSSFWRDVNLLNIQKNGNSQNDMLAILEELKLTKFGKQKKEKSDTYIYIDDVLFTGNRIGNDLELWIQDSAPDAADLHIIVLGLHKLGNWQLGERLKKAVTASGKDIKFKTWRGVELENRKAYRDRSEILWPVSLPASAAEYGQGKFAFEPRNPGQTHFPFSSENGRQRLELAFVEAGMKIRSFSENSAPIMRPLGFSPFGLGFGSTIVTYRNCPNNAPLALWWGDPSKGRLHPLGKWLPLVPRKTYG